MITFTRYLAAACACFILVFALCPATPSQGAKRSGSRLTAAVPVALPKVTQIDIEGLRKLLKPNGKPLLINFWATWCDPCREEFPDLVKLDGVYHGRIDFLTVSLDDLADINTEVPKFLGEMKAEMPAYLLHTKDDDAAITLVSKEWKGNLPLTILITPAGETVYTRNGKVKYDAAVGEIDKLLAPAPVKQ